MSAASLGVDAFDLLAAVGLVTLAAVIAVVVRAGIRERRDGHGGAFEERR